MHIVGSLFAQTTDGCYGLHHVDDTKHRTTRRSRRAHLLGLCRCGISMGLVKRKSTTVSTIVCCRRCSFFVWKACQTIWRSACAGNFFFQPRVTPTQYGDRSTRKEYVPPTIRQSVERTLPKKLTLIYNACFLCPSSIWSNSPICENHCAYLFFLI